MADVRDLIEYHRASAEAGLEALARLAGIMALARSVSVSRSFGRGQDGVVRLRPATIVAKQPGNGGK